MPVAKITALGPSLQPWQPTASPDRQIAVLMSGGVDSSVTAYLLKQCGWEVLGITMKIPVSGGNKTCCGADAAFACHQLGICHYFLDVTGLFSSVIIEPSRRAYLHGLTPNPCAACNTFLKFRLVWRFIENEFGIKYLATGHYARVVRYNGGWTIAMAKDIRKDQSYFLYGIPADRLPFLILPLGQYSKQQVRAIARQIGLLVADRPESMDLCFVGPEGLGSFLAQKHYQVLDPNGRVLGSYTGQGPFSIGQRRGLRIAAGKPLYVHQIDPSAGILILGTRQTLYSRLVTAGQMRILMPSCLVKGARLTGKVRSYGPVQPCTVSSVARGSCTVQFDQPQFAPCPGQKLVLYDQDQRIVAGGTIMRLHRGGDNGFTLIELLVVIAIIGLLLGILVPCLTQARGLAKRIRCSHNLRQINISLCLYTQNNDQVYPCAQDPVSLDPYYWLWMGRGWRRLVRPYLAADIDANNPSVLWCPQDPTDKAKYESTSYAYSMCFYHSPDQINLMDSPADTYDKTRIRPSIPQRTSQVRRPSGKIVIGEWLANHSNQEDTKGWWGWQGARNYLFPDGHVGFIDANQIHPARDGNPNPCLTIDGIGGVDYQ